MQKKINRLRFKSLDDLKTYLQKFFRPILKWLSIGYDGLIYREGGEGENREQLTGYVFYNYAAIDTWDGWQKRKEGDDF